MENHHILQAALAGLACALIFSSIPVGPVNLTILNEGAQRGFRWAFMIGLGAATMDCTYCAISFTGFSSFFDIKLVRATMQVGSFLFLLYLGFKFLTAQTVKVPTKLDHASERIEARLEQKLHPHSAFMTGFVRVMGNLGVPLIWIVLTANLMSHEWVANKMGAKVACVAGVASGTVIWFIILSYGVSRSHGRISEQTLLRLQHLSGICLILAGVFDGFRIIWHLRV
jgi:threonine/homoserine/homoserine lactone efflux protein